MNFMEVESLLKHTTHSTYPVVVSREQPYLVGQIQRRDLQIALSMFLIKTKEKHADGSNTQIICDCL